MENIKEKSIEELEQLASKIRDKIIKTVSQTGGHLTSPLGATELIIAMHYVFDVRKDPFIFDVSHQAYPHKLLTNRWDNFDTLRTYKGISGFTKPKESPLDYFVAGHSSTSISLAVGSAKAIALEKSDRIPVVMIGDGSMTSGMIYEALNELGQLKLPVVIILNDNEMSIAKPIGAISEHLSRLLAGEFCQNIKKKTEKILAHLPSSATYIAKRVEESMKLITPGILFEEMGIDYIGPVDGHNLETIIKTLEVAKNIKKPIIVHAQTVKGKGYDIAEGKFEHWHGVSPFNIDNGKAIKKSTSKSATAIFSDALLDLASKNDKIVGVTAAMPSGTGIDKLIEKFPNRFWDVAIAEQHAVTSMSAMAKEGFKPFITIYSTFLQRAYDQIIHDSALMGLPTVFAIDRAGIVGADGETHQGVFDISYLRHIPNLIIFAPRDEKTLIDAVNFASTLPKTSAFRYPRGSFQEFNIPFQSFKIGKAQLIKNGTSKKLFIGYGAGVNRAYETINYLNEDIALLDLRFIKPLDKTILKELSKKYDEWFIFSDTAKMGGVASTLMEFLSDENIFNIKVKSFEYDDNFIQHGDTKLIENELEITPKQLAQKIQDNLC